MHATSKEIRAAFRYAEEHDLHTAKCSARSMIDAAKQSSTKAKLRIECNCGAIDRALRVLRREKAPTEKVGGRAAMRRRLRDIAETARFVPGSDEARQARVHTELNRLTALRNVQTLYARADQRDYLLMGWWMQHRRHGYTPAQRLVMSGAAQALMLSEQLPNG